MSKPVKGTTRGRTGKRRSHQALSATIFAKCEKCSAPTLPHKACLTCGSYKGRQVINVEKRINRRIKKLKSVS